MLDLHRKGDHGKPGGRQRLQVGQPLDLEVLAGPADHVRRPKRIRNAFLVIRGHVAGGAVQPPRIDADHANALVKQIVTAVGMKSRLQVRKLGIVEMLVGIGAKKHDLARREFVADLRQRLGDIVPGDELCRLLVRKVEADAASVAPFQRDLLDRFGCLTFAGWAVVQGSVNVSAPMGRKRDSFVGQGHTVRIAARQEVEVGSTPAGGFLVVHPHDFRTAGLEGLISDRHAKIDKAHCGILEITLAPWRRRFAPARPIWRARP